MATNTTQKQAAKQFVQDWSGKGYEKGETARFWIALLQNVYGIQDATKFMEFELPVKTILKEKGSDFIDGYISSTKVLIEQKGSGVKLTEKYRQSDGSELTPYQQARRYAAGLPLSMAPRWIVACNFTTFEVHDMEHPNDAPEIIELKDLEKEYHRLTFLVDDTNVHLKKELEVSIQAGEIVGVLYDKILAQYKDPSNPETQKSLNKLCVRLVFCMYAEDAGIFGKKDMFHGYMDRFNANDFRKALIELFQVLDTKPEDRDPYMDEALAEFPYVNGGMFAGDIEIPRINEEIRTLILQRASDDFDWSLISPTIFGAVFESTLNPETRRAGGMHYTSIENIHKVIDPLFLNDLKAELADIRATSVAKTKKEKARAFQEKIARLKFLDPACGSGNFLTESYTSLRRLENEVLRIVYGGDRVIGEMADPIKVSINQFYGIEINDFACSVAQTALWIAESQMMAKTDEIVGFNLDPLPLKTYNNIREGNALRVDWGEWEEAEDTPTIVAEHTDIYPYKDAPALEEPVVKYGSVDLYSKEISIHSTSRKSRKRRVQFDYIMGNPPFVGYDFLVPPQQEEMQSLFGPKTGRLDYVTAWYVKAAQFILGKPIKCAFVSTNSISQGVQVPDLWLKLINDYDIHIDFAYRTFQWDSEASIKAHVHCIIVGFSNSSSKPTKKVLYYGDKAHEVSNISPYLIDAPTVIVQRRSTPLNGAQELNLGSLPKDGGGFILSEEEATEILNKEPLAAQWIKPYIGATEFINNKKRYCLWLVNADPSEIRRCSSVLKHIEMVRDFRLESKAASTRALADTPTLFAQIAQPDSTYVLVPRTSSGRRKYVPMGYMDANQIASDAVQTIKDANLITFGVLMSRVHNLWLDTVGGKLKSDYRYSKDIVYNTFPWPEISEAQGEAIQRSAQTILDARGLFPNSSLGDLYDDLTMPPELRKAHRANDAAVLEAYGFPKDATESDIVARLLKLYQELNTSLPSI